MGTITIEEYSTAGSGKQRDLPVHDLDTLLTTTVDASTSTSSENITLNSGTSVINVYAVETHRVAITSDTTGTTYATIPAGTSRDLGVAAGETLYYRLDA